MDRGRTAAWNPSTNVRVMLGSDDGSYVQLEDINDQGDVVGWVGGQAVVWHVRQKDLR